MSIPRNPITIGCRCTEISHQLNTTSPPAACLNISCAVLPFKDRPFRACPCSHGVPPGVAAALCRRALGRSPVFPLGGPRFVVATGRCKPPAPTWRPLRTARSLLASFRKIGGEQALLALVDRRVEDPEGRQPSRDFPLNCSTPYLSHSCTQNRRRHGQCHRDEIPSDFIPVASAPAHTTSRGNLRLL